VIGLGLLPAILGERVADMGRDRAQSIDDSVALGLEVTEVCGECAETSLYVRRSLGRLLLSLGDQLANAFLRGRDDPRRLLVGLLALPPDRVAGPPTFETAAYVANVQIWWRAFKGCT
jgi:hypothetical protein